MKKNALSCRSFFRAVFWRLDLHLFLVCMWLRFLFKQGILLFVMAISPLTHSNGYSVMEKEKEMGEKKLSMKTITGIVAACLVLLVLVIVGFQSFTTIPEGYVGMKYQLGKIVNVDLEAGITI